MIYDFYRNTCKTKLNIIISQWLRCRDYLNLILIHTSSSCVCLLLMGFSAAEPAILMIVLCKDEQHRVLFVKEFNP